MSGDRIEPPSDAGRWISETGQIRYTWPPEGRYAELWARLDGAFTDDDKHAVRALLNLWLNENSTLVAYTDEDGEWVDVEPDWTIPDGWGA